MRPEPIIRVEGLWKRYGVPWPSRAAPWSLRDVSFEVAPGDSLGVIGRNGAGKSTLLKVLAGVTPPSRGRVDVAGRVFPMIELNAGVNRDLTGRENVELLGAVMGFDRREVAASLPEIESFCELGDWFERPARTYSSGMLARLGFGVAMNVEADVFLVDEVLAVGDFAFQRKCIDRISRLSSNGASVVFVSHNPYLLERMCDRVVMLRQGALEELGQPSDVIHRYFELDADADAAPGAADPAASRPGSGELRIEAVEILDGQGAPAAELETGGPMRIRLHYVASVALREPNFAIRIVDPHNTLVVAFESTLARRGTTLAGKGHIDCEIASLPLMPGVYTVQVKAAGEVLFDLFENAARFRIASRPEILLKSGSKGIAYADARWEFA